MMTNVRTHSALGFLYLDAPPLAASLVISERFFRFGSFTLEALAFLVLWFVLSGVYTQGLTLLCRKSGRVPPKDRKDLYRY